MSPKKSFLVFIFLILALYFTTYFETYSYHQPIDLRTHFHLGCPDQVVLTKTELKDLLDLLYPGNLTSYGQYKGETEHLPELYQVPAKCLDDVRIVVFGGKSVGLKRTLREHRKNLVEEFKGEHGNPKNLREGERGCREKRCKLEPYKKDDPQRLKPDDVIKDKKPENDDVVIDEELEKLKRFHLSRGDDDLSKMPEVLEEKIKSTLEGYKVTNNVK